MSSFGAADGLKHQLQEGLASDRVLSPGRGRGISGDTLCIAIVERGPLTRRRDGGLLLCLAP
jgi:hypothetical protein